MGNNLSYPAVFTGGAMSLRGVANEWTLGDTFSYGCAIAEGTYPNTSCVDALGLPLSYEACAAGPCAGADIERVYWQQQDLNTWQAGSASGAGAQRVAYLDWGDNLESVSWSERSIIRVETTPFADYGDVTQRGFQMWHVFGQGPDEMWGVRATDADPPLPYVYDSPYAIIHDGNTRLTLTKLFAATATCPTTPSSGSGFTGSWDPVNKVWLGAAFDSGPLAYTTELNIGGKIVYGYNWRLSRMVVVDATKSGWWRLTFYTNDDLVLFDAASPVVALAPPVLPDATPAIVALSEEEGEGSLYTPVVDYTNNLTYIDICVTTARGGGGGSRRP